MTASHPEAGQEAEREGIEVGGGSSRADGIKVPRGDIREGIHRQTGGSEMKFTPVGIDIAKQVFQVHYVDESTGEVVNRPLRRSAFLQHFVNRSACLIGMEACSGAQHWARELTKLGHQVRLMPARFVKAFNARRSRRCWRCTGCASS